MNPYRNGMMYVGNRSDISDFSTEELADEIAKRERKKDRVRELESALNKINENKDRAVVTGLEQDSTGKYSVTIEVN